MEVNIENEMVNLVFKNQGKQKWSKKIFFKIYGGGLCDMCMINFMKKW